MDISTLKKAWEERRSAIEAYKAADVENPTAEQRAEQERIEADIRRLDEKIANGLQAVEAEKRFSAVLDSAPAPKAESRNDVEGFAAAEREAFRKFVGGEGRSLDFAPLPAELRALVKGTASAGGNLVPTTMFDRIIVAMRELSTVMAANATVVTTASGEDITVPQSNAFPAASIIAENSAISVSEPSFAQVTIGAFKYALLAQLSPELLADSAFDAEGYMAEVAAQALANGPGAHFMTGSGTGQPNGLMTASTLGKTTTSATAVTADELFDLYHSVLRPYRTNAVWLFSDSAVAAIRKLKDSSNQYLWQPGLALGQPDTLLGRPVLTDPAIAAYGTTGNKFGGFGDVRRAYLIRFAGGVRVERSNDYAFNTDLVTWKFVQRADGEVVDTAAFKHIKHA